MKLYFFVLSLIFQSLNAQSLDIIDSFESYSEAPREVVYVHLNKSTYLNGEMLGLKAYVFDKFSKSVSTTTNNLYCTISDENGKIIKKKLLHVKNGVAHNVFNVDSTLSSGIFTFKAYTNWMLNFNEKNHFSQTFKVLNNNQGDLIKPIPSKNLSIDLQVLGEGGHIIYDTENSIGIIAKNELGYGVANAEGDIKDNNGEVVTKFMLNDVGLCKVQFTPQKNKTYKANLNIKGKIISKEIKIEDKGVILHLQEDKDRLYLNISTNSNSLTQLINKPLQLSLHNGEEITLTSFYLDNNGKASLDFSLEELYVGINIFTVFNHENKPVLERLYFNKAEINLSKIKHEVVTTKSDSLEIVLNTLGNNLSDNSNISVSILPQETKSYNHNSNVFSQLYIQPYIKGVIENGFKYFEDTDANKDLDLLMMTQGWSSYNWNSIFNENEIDYKFNFEKGINIIANLNKDKQGTYLVYPFSNMNTKLFDIKINQKEFLISNVFPTEDDLLRIGYLDNKKKDFKKDSSIYLQFYPAEFPELKDEYQTIIEAYTLNDTSINIINNTNAWTIGSINELDEVLIEAKSKNTKVEKLKEKSTKMKFRVIEDNSRISNMRLDTYIQRLGFDTYYDIFSGKLTITNPKAGWRDNVGSGGLSIVKDNVPLVYLDGTLLTTSGLNSDFSLLTFLTMENVDYIEYELYGTDGGLRGSAGTIKIFTSPDTKKNKPNNLKTYQIPLVFNNPKQFYVPKYQYYNTDFFKEYGTIDWKPNVKFDENGKAYLKILDTKTETISLFVEGIINDNQFISQEIKVERPN